MLVNLVNHSRQIKCHIKVDTVIKDDKLSEMFTDVLICVIVTLTLTSNLSGINLDKVMRNIVFNVCLWIFFMWLLEMRLNEYQCKSFPLLSYKSNMSHT